MSETAPANDVPESNGTVDQPPYNGETEEHISKYIKSICVLFVSAALTGNLTITSLIRQISSEPRGEGTRLCGWQ